jgi:hypothetical protein
MLRELETTTASDWGAVVVMKVVEGWRTRRSEEEPATPLALLVTPYRR